MRSFAQPFPACTISIFTFSLSVDFHFRSWPLIALRTTSALHQTSDVANLILICQMWKSSTNDLSKTISHSFDGLSVLHSSSKSFTHKLHILQQHRSSLYIITIDQTMHDLRTCVDRRSSFWPSLEVPPDFFSSAKHRSLPPVIYPRLSLMVSDLSASRFQSFDLITIARVWSVNYGLYLFWSCNQGFRQKL